MSELIPRKKSVYERYIKRILDIICASLALVVFGWLYFIVAVLVKIEMGSPVIFKQPRPGENEKIFYIYKFRTMTEEKNNNGEYLEDNSRQTKLGSLLRNSSLDEIVEAINILKGDMSVVGPRPQLVRDMVFMTPEQRQRHTAKPGLTGLAQVNGRNAMTWEDKFMYDLEYIDNVSFINDCKIVIKTISKAFISHEGADSVIESSEDFGDDLLRRNVVSKKEYEEKQKLAKELIKESGKNE